MLNIYTFYIVLAAVLDIFANLALNKSNGFRNFKWASISILLVWMAFYLLSLSLGQIKLSIAYSLWGAIGILGTVLGGWYFFGQKLKPIGFVGIFIIIIAIYLLESA